MIAAGIVLLSMGIPSVALGLYYRKNPSAPPKGKKAPKGQKGRKKGQSQKARRPDDAPRSGGGGLSLIVGGVAFSLIGVGFLVAHFIK